MPKSNKVSGYEIVIKAFAPGSLADIHLLKHAQETADRAVNLLMEECDAKVILEIKPTRR